MNKYGVLLNTKFVSTPLNRKFKPNVHRTTNERLYLHTEVVCLQNRPCAIGENVSSTDNLRLSVLPFGDVPNINIHIEKSALLKSLHSLSISLLKGNKPV